VYYIVFGDVWLGLRGIDPDTAKLTPGLGDGRTARAEPRGCLRAGIFLRRLEAATWDAVRVGLLVLAWVWFQAMAVVARCCTSTTRWVCT